MSNRWCSLVWLGAPLMALGIGFASILGTSAQSVAPAYLDPDYRNRVYTERPSQPSLSQPEFNSIAITSGHVGPTNVAELAKNPNNGSQFLIRAVIGQPVAGNPARIFGEDFKFGQPIVPAANLGAKGSVEPIAVVPKTGARWIAGLNQLIAAAPGFVEVTWRPAVDGAPPLSAVRYRISNEPVRDPVHLYHSHAVAKFKQGELTTPFAQAFSDVPRVSIPPELDIDFKWNEAIPESDTVEGRVKVFLERDTVGALQCAEKTGLLLVEYRQRPTGTFKDLEIIHVRSPNEPSENFGANIGDRLLPVNRNHLPTTVQPTVRYGDAFGETENFVYQHKVSGPQNGEVYAIRDTDLVPSGKVAIEIFWSRRSINEIVWPYELTRYSARWPKSTAEKYQLFARDRDFPRGGASVYLPSDQNASVMPFRETDGRAADIHVPANEFGKPITEFWTTDAGWSLLKFTPGDKVAFQVVRSVLHTDLSVFKSTTESAIGKEIIEASHQIVANASPLVSKPGYIHTPVGDRYDWEVYDGRINGTSNPTSVIPGAITGQIFPVNTGTLEVWWANAKWGAQWWSQVRRYEAQWTNVTSKVVIAAYQRNVIEREPTFRARMIAENQKDARLYAQNDRSKFGFNPNDEHALIDQGIVYALRDDLGANNSVAHTLLKYRDASANPRWQYTVFNVVAEESPYFFHYPGRAGNLIQQPLPISVLPYCKQNSAAPGGPHWRDRKDRYWAMAAGNDGSSSADIIMHWYYPAQENFFFPDAPNQRTGVCVPWLDARAETPGVPINVTYTVFWPDQIPTQTSQVSMWPEAIRSDVITALGPSREVPALEVGETLVTPKRGLPAVNGQCSAEIIYQQAVSNKLGESVHLIDPLKVRKFKLDSLPADVAREQVNGRIVFNKLPPHLRERLTYDDSAKELRFQGLLKTPALGDPWLLPNIITAREKVLLDSDIMGADGVFHRALESLATSAKDAIRVNPEDTDFDGLALTAGFASASGYVTLAFQNHRSRCNEALPVSVEVIKVTCPLYRGYVRTVLPDSPLDEMQTLRFDGELAGKSDTYEFQWQVHRDEGGIPPSESSTNWRAYSTVPVSGGGANDVTIAGPGIFTLSDNWFRCRYRALVNPLCLPGADPSDPRGWSPWTSPQLAEGWIKRVLAGINRFDQCFSDLADPTRKINTLVSMLSRAGRRWQGNVPLNTADCDSYGLIELYETVLRRGIDFSIEGTPPVDDLSVNQSLLLAAGQLADLYMLLGNEAYADAADPTVGVPTSGSGSFQGAPSSIHAFMNLTEGGANSLLDEELSLLRGRDDSRGAPGVDVPPIFNRLVWNFSRGDGQVAYKLNYDIRDQTGAFDGKITEDDAKFYYPQGHGDAYGHYLTTIKNYYRLLRNDNYTWIPRSEAIQIGGVPVTVDYLDERKFARAAAAKVRTAAEIISLTYRSVYSEDPSVQWMGYKDSYESRKSSHPLADEKAGAKERRGWGLAEWGSRAGQGALLDWVVGNALLPASYSPSVRITRATLEEIGASASYLLTQDILLNAAEQSGASFFEFQSNDLINLSTFIDTIRQINAPIAAHLRSHFSAAYAETLNGSDLSPESRKFLESTLLMELNRMLERRSFYNQSAFSSIKLSDETTRFLGASEGTNLRHRNRLLLNDAFPSQIKRDSLFYQALSRLVGRQVIGRANFRDALNAAFAGEVDSTLVDALINKSQTSGLPEGAFRTIEVLIGTHFPSKAALAAELQRANRLGPATFALFGEGILNSVEIDPAEPANGVEQITRESVVELREVASGLRTIQNEVDKADLGLNPLGLVKNVLPFDIDPVQIEAGKSHFEQIYDRAVTTLNNAIAVFNRAAGSTQALRQQADEQTAFEKTVREREQDYKSRMVELFGYPYPEDIGGAGAYPAGYDGPDIYHFSYVDPSELVGESPGVVEEFKLLTQGLTADVNASREPLKRENRYVTFHLSRNGFGEVKPPEWRGRRRAPGEIQVARSELIQAKARFDKAVLEYGNFLAQAEDQAALLKAQYDLNAEELRINLGAQKAQQDLNQAIRRARERQLDFQTKGRVASLVANAFAQGLPSVLIFGLSSGGDPSFIPRQAILLAGAVTTEIMTQNSNREQLAELDHQQAKELVQSQTSIQLTTLQKDFALEQQLLQLQQLLRSEAVQRLEIYSLIEAMQQASGRYMSTLARAERLQEDFLRFRKETAADTSDRRYKDMAFRIFRNDALQKYRAQFDLAAAYVYMAARAYDWETGMLENDSRKPGQGFLSEIVRTRAIGLVQDGRPQTASSQGDPGLADPMARMSANWQTLKGQLGFYVPQREDTRFSLRRELFRIQSDLKGSGAWRDTLRQHAVPNVLDDPRFQRFARPFTDVLSSREPAIVIPFESNITFALNFFGWPLAPNDSAYGASLASTKIRGVGVWFVNYNTTGLANTPRVYLIPVGDDVFRSPTRTPASIRQWTVVDQALPAPFPIGIQDVNRAGWIPTLDSLSGSFTDIRRFADFRAYHDSGTFKESEIVKDSRLIGRSVWNTKWLLIIPAGTLLNDRQQALDTFIDGKLVNGKRDGNGVSDILLLFQTYATPGN